MGMGSLFSGASRAVLMATVFAIESTGQTKAFTAVVGACFAAFFVSLLIKYSLLTAKIAHGEHASTLNSCDR